jgi:hypothetical protein
LSQDRTFVQSDFLLSDLARDSGKSSGGGEAMGRLPGEFRIEEGGIQGKGLLVNGLDMPGEGMVPIDDAYLLVAETIYLFLMALPN